MLDVPLTQLLGPVFFEGLDGKFIESAGQVAADLPYRFPFAAWGAKAAQQKESVPGLREIVGGLAPGERVIVDGLQQIRPGETVEPQVVAMPTRKG